MKRAVYAQWAYMSAEREREREGGGGGAALNKAVGFAQSSRKSKWAQSKRPGGRRLTGEISSPKCPTGCLRPCANPHRFASGVFPLLCALFPG